MYRGCNKTALLSQQTIADTLFDLMTEEPFAAITIAEICRDADISRQTFYTLFSSKENVVRYRIRENACYDPQAGELTGDLLLQKLADYYSSWIISEQDMLMMLYRNGLMSYIHDYQYEAFTSDDCLMAQIAGSRCRYIADFLASGLTSVASVYVAEGASASQEQLADLIRSLFASLFE